MKLALMPGETVPRPEINELGFSEIRFTLLLPAFIKTPKGFCIVYSLHATVAEALF